MFLELNMISASVKTNEICMEPPASWFVQVITNEMFLAILIPTMIIGVMGWGFGYILAYAAKKFYVEIDPKIEMVVDVLPSANCGACGMPGCIGYAEAVVTKGLDITLCTPGGANVIKKIGEILGKTAEAKEKMIPIFHCNSGGYTNTNLKYSYFGIENCRAVRLLANGPNNCDYGCLFQNDCITICKFGCLNSVADTTLSMYPLEHPIRVRQ